MSDDFVSVPTPVTDSLAAWAAWPDVLADYYQRGEGGVWTERGDVLPGRRLHAMFPLVAAWGEMTWSAMPAPEPGDPTLVWLQPVTGPSLALSPEETHSIETLCRLVVADLETVVAGRDDWAPVEAALRRSLHRHIAGVLADFSATASLLQREVRRDRRLATELLSTLGELPPAVGRRILRSPAGGSLFRLARRVRAPRQRSEV